jgi:hypothetical protein
MNPQIIKINNNILSFSEWLKKHPDRHSQDHFSITSIEGEKIIEMIKDLKGLKLNIEEGLFIKKFQYFLYVKSIKNINNMNYYYK